jgi:hypothetical protein
MNTTTPQERNEIAGLTLKYILNQFPIAGPILTGIFFEFRSKVRQERINHFVGLMERELSRLNIDPEKLKTEEQLDLFENVFKKVMETRSEKKRVAFKNILVYGIKSKDNIHACELFFELLSQINEAEVMILKEHGNFLVQGQSALRMRNTLKGQLEYMGKDGETFRSIASATPSYLDLKEEYQRAKKTLDDYIQNCTPHYFGMDKGQYLFHLQNLSAKGLLIDDGTGAIGTNNFGTMSLTEFGQKFIRFIEN